MMRDFPLIRHLHEETKRPMHVPFDERKWPASWSRVEFKEYPRFPQTTLPDPATPAASFTETLQKRSSKRNFDPNTALSLEKLSSLLYWGAGISRNKEDPARSFRFYPSGGARYSLEIYLSLKNVGGVRDGIYHYNVKHHSLEQLGPAAADQQIRELPNYPWVRNASAILFISTIPERVTRKYRERGYRFVHLEAGALLGNLYTVAAALQLGCSALGTIVEDEAREIFNIRGDEEVLVHMAFGEQVPTDSQQ